MRFPRVLSKERLSLLSPEDRKIYEYEHSALYVETEDDIIEDNIDIDENVNYNLTTYNNLNEDYLTETFFYELFDSTYYDKDLIKEIGIKDYNIMKKNIYEFIKDNNDLTPLNEYGGIAIDYWAKGIKLGWLGKLAAGLLTGLVGLIAWLLMKGKDRLAMVQLKKYMNKIVELVDQGVNKKRPWYSFLMPSKKALRNTGDYNKACFRTIQETAERNMACLYAQAIHSLGFLNPSRSNFDGITSGFIPEKGSGLNKFNDIVNSLSSNMVNVYLPDANDMELPLKPEADIYETLKLPALPTNFKMLMCNIDYPTKAKTNPNGSLFMKPTLEILNAKAEDIGSAYFNKDVNLSNVINIKQTNEDYFIPYEFIQKALFEVESELTGMDKLSGISGGGLLTGDLTGSGLGAELSLEIQGKEETTVNNFKGNIIDAIDNYIRASVPIIAKLIRAISGKSSGDRTSSEYLLLILQMQAAAENNMDAFFKEHSKDLLSISLSNNDRNYEIVSANQEISNLITALNIKLRDLNELQKIKADPKKSNEFLNKITKQFISGTLNKNNLAKAFSLSFKSTTLEKFLTEGTLNNFYSYNKLYEDDGSNGKTDTQKLENQFLTNIRKTYDNIKNMLSIKITGIIHNNPADWYIITNSRERMNKLKEAANKEITAKIDLICRTANSGRSDLGDKFKAALSTHPVRAEGLKGLWAKYYDDLDDRIESRIRSITGDNGNSNILDTIKQFLSVTYPNLIAMMVYYKQIFYLIKTYTNEHPLSKKTQEQIVQEQSEENNKILTSILNFKNQNQ